MIHNRTICTQEDMTDRDLDILLRLKTPIEPRKYDRQDYHIMRCRTAASVRGANPIETQNSVFNIADKTTRVKP